jgi:hypothetical protein
MILTRGEMVKSVLELLHKSVENIPEERRGEVLGSVIDSFSQGMFQGSLEKEEE